MTENGHSQYLPPLLLVACCLASFLPMPSSALNAQHRTLPSSAAPFGDSFVWKGKGGSYKLGIQEEDQWRVETRDEDGAVQGQYFYRTPDGGKVNVQFNSGFAKPETQDKEERLRLVPENVGDAGQVLKPVQSSELEEVLAALREQGMLPYGALKIAGDRGHMLPAGSTDKEDVASQAVITEV